MRSVLIVLIALTTQSAGAVSSKEDCAKFGEQFQDVLPFLKGVSESLETTRYWRAIDGRGDLRTAVEQAEAARIALVPDLKAYLAAMEDLTYQLQVCARG